MKRPRITLQDWLQFLEYKHIRFTHVLAVFTAALSLLVFIVAVLSLTKDVILWFGITFDNLVLVGVLVIHYSFCLMDVVL